MFSFTGLCSILVVNAPFGGLNRNVGQRIELFAKCYSEGNHMGRGRSLRCAQVLTPSQQKIPGSQQSNSRACDYNLRGHCCIRTRAATKTRNCLGDVPSTLSRGPTIASAPCWLGARRTSFKNAPTEFFNAPVRPFVSEVRYEALHVGIQCFFHAYFVFRGGFDEQHTERVQKRDRKLPS
jgi:hypothetical protein